MLIGDVNSFLDEVSIAFRTNALLADCKARFIRSACWYAHSSLHILGLFGYLSLTHVLDKHLCAYKKIFSEIFLIVVNVCADGV